MDIKEEKVDEGVLENDPMSIVRSQLDCSDTSQYIECWNATYVQRQEMLSQMTTIEYLASFPYSLKSDCGFEIVSL